MLTVDEYKCPLCDVIFRSIAMAESHERRFGHEVFEIELLRMNSGDAE